MKRFIDIPAIKKMLTRENYQDIFLFSMLEDLTKDLVFDGKNIFNKETGERFEMKVEETERFNSKTIILKGTNNKDGIKHLRIGTSFNSDRYVWLQLVKENDLLCINFMADHPINFKDFGLKNDGEISRYKAKYREEAKSSEYFEITRYEDVINRLAEEGLFATEYLESGHDYTAIFANRVQKESAHYIEGEEPIWPSYRTAFSINSKITIEEPTVEVPKNIFDIENGVKVTYKYNKTIVLEKDHKFYDSKILDIPCESYEYAVKTLKYLVPKEIQKMENNREEKYSKKLKL